MRCLSYFRSLIDRFTLKPFFSFNCPDVCLLVCHQILKLTHSQWSDILEIWHTHVNLMTMWGTGYGILALQAGSSPRVGRSQRFIILLIWNLLLTYLTVLIYLTTQVWSTKGTARKISSVKNIFFDISFNKKFSFRFLTCMFVILLRLYPALKILQLIWWWWCYLLPQKPYSYLSSASAKTGQL